MIFLPDMRGSLFTVDCAAFLLILEFFSSAVEFEN